ncbi:TlpA family protein disulfide reductase [bacterium]|nr:TlpA family protein disulfide reductase [bacterium]
MTHRDTFNNEKYQYHFLFLVTLTFILLLNPLVAFCDSINPGDKAQNLLGNDAMSGNRVNLFMAMTELQFKRDDRGFLVIENGKYINEFVRNVVVLNFFSRVCIPCIREIPVFNRIAKKYGNNHVKFLYINVDPDLSQEQAQQFIKNYHIEVPMMLCNQAEAIRKYDAATLPRLYVIDQKKRISHIFKGLDENLESELIDIIDKLLKNPIEP